MCAYHHHVECQKLKTASNFQAASVGACPKLTGNLCMNLEYLLAGHARVNEAVNSCRVQGGTKLQAVPMREFHTNL